MGLALTDEGFIPVPKKQDCIVSIPVPTNNDEVRRLLGVFACLSRFSEVFLIKSEPLTALLKIKEDWKVFLQSFALHLCYQNFCTRH